MIASQLSTNSYESCIHVISQTQHWAYTQSWSSWCFFFETYTILYSESSRSHQIFSTTCYSVVIATKLNTHLLLSIYPFDIRRYFARCSRDQELLCACCITLFSLVVINFILVYNFNRPCVTCFNCCHINHFLFCVIIHTIQLFRLCMLQAEAKNREKLCENE